MNRFNLTIPQPSETAPQPPPRRTTFCELTTAMEQEHRLCASNDDKRPLKAWYEPVSHSDHLAGIVMRCIVRCDQCGGHAVDITQDDVREIAEINRRRERGA